VLVCDSSKLLAVNFQPNDPIHQWPFLYLSGRTWANVCGSSWLCVSGVGMGTGRNIHLDELSLVMRLEQRTLKDSSSRWIMRLVPVFVLETHSQMNNRYWPRFVQMDNASSTIKMVNGCQSIILL